MHVHYRLKGTAERGVSIAFSNNSASVGITQNSCDSTEKGVSFTWVNNMGYGTELSKRYFTKKMHTHPTTL